MHCSESLSLAHPQRSPAAIALNPELAAAPAPESVERRPLRLSDFDYWVPPELIAQEPVSNREDARLLVLERAKGALTHRRFPDLADYLHPGDLVVLNDTRVLPARLLGRIAETGDRVDVLLLCEVAPRTWRVAVKPARRARPGRVMVFGPEARAEVTGAEPDGRRLLTFTPGTHLPELLARHGVAPLPPYIKRLPTEADRTRYQTVYARAPGAVAAPTAGLHFTEPFLAQLAGMGVEIASLTLHVGEGTFRAPVHEALERHGMDPEPYIIPASTVDAVGAARAAGRRVLAVGTTSVRALETAWHDGPPPQRTLTGTTDLFIKPPFDFRVTDAFLTNFHQPRTTLLMLVAAFAGLETTLDAYRTAIEARYRLFSYGDAMLIL